MEQPSAQQAVKAQPARGDTLQAVLSGLVFGTLGSVSGAWLGAKGGEHGPRLFTKKLMTMMGGFFAGVVAVYVSLRNGEGKDIQTELPATTAASPKPLMEAAPQPLPAHAVHDAVLGARVMEPSLERTL